MKIFYSFICIFFLLVSCRQDNKSTGEKEDSVVNVPATKVESPVPFYKAILKKLDTTEVGSVTVAAEKFSELFAKADTAQADSGFIAFSSFYDKIGSNVNEQHVKDSANYMAYVPGFSSQHAKKTAATDERVKQLKANGFTIDISEGSTYIRQDRNFLAKYFYPLVSPVMKEYLVQLNKENEEGFLEDAGLVITPVELSNRLILWEKFLTKNPTFPFADDIKQQQRGYLTFLLEGIDNSPLMEHGTSEIRKIYVDAYNNIIQNHPQSATAGLIRPYYEALKQKDSKKAQSLLQQYKKQGLIYDYSA